jgi:NarL family two-component system response regulator LiaR
MTKIRVALVDDHTLVTQGVQMLLEDYDDLEVVGSATGGAAGVELCAELEPDVVLMDLSMPDVDGVEAARRILSASPRICVIALTGHLDEDQLRAVVDAGANGYLLKTASGDDLAEAIRGAAAGRATFSMEALTRLRPRDPGDGADLTARELDVLACLSGGATNKAIARELALSPGTVRVHVSSILAKLGVQNRTEAALKAVREGLVVDPVD